MRAIDPGTRDLTLEVFDAHGAFRILPTEFWAQTSQQERSLLCLRHGMYLLPTLELVEDLKRRIAGRSAIEIGSGNGVLAAALGIHATDNRMQEWPKYKALYATLGQTTIRYGKDVEAIDAIDAVARYRPQVVIAAWVTHKYDPARHVAGGNEMGVIEEKIIDRVEDYVFIGNTQVHEHKSIWPRPHQLEHPDFIFSRALNGSKDFLATWKKGSSVLL